MSKPVRLMQITHDLNIGGLQQVVVNLCRAIDRKKFQVSVLCLRDLGPLTSEIEQLGIKVILLPQKEKGTDYFSFFKVARILRQERIQVIHTHNTQPLVDGTLGAILSGGRQRIIHTDHAREFPDKKRYMFAEWCMSHFVYKMVGVSEETTENLRRFEKIPRRKLLTIENGTDGSRFQISIDKQTKRKELGIPDAGPIIGVISRIEKVKGINYLLQCMTRVISEFPDITLLVVGEGSEKANLERQAKEAGIEKHVIFTGERQDIPEILQLLDIYLLPSLSEGLPMGLLEAMAAKCPAIASAVGGIPQVVKDGESALLTEPGQPESIAQVVVRCLKDEDVRVKLQNNAFEVFSGKFDVTSMSRQYMELYQ